ASEPRHAHARRHTGFVNVQSGAALDQPLHGQPPARQGGDRPEELRSAEFARRALRQQCGVPIAPAPNWGRSRTTIPSAAGAGRPQAHPIAFHSAGWARRAHENWGAISWPPIFIGGPPFSLAPHFHIAWASP